MFVSFLRYTYIIFNSLEPAFVKIYLIIIVTKLISRVSQVQPSDCLTQLLNVCKAVSFADKDLLLEGFSLTAFI